MMVPPEFESAPASTPAPEATPASPAPSAPAPESAPVESPDQPTQAMPAAPKPTPELTLREKIQKKAEEVAARNQKDPVTGKFLAKKPEIPGEVTPAKTPEKAPEVPVKPAAGAQNPPEAGAFTPNFKLRIMDEPTEREIPELLRPLMKDEASAKAVKEIMEKAYGLEYVKPKLEETRVKLGQETGKNQQIMGQIGHAQKLFQAGDIDGWLKMLSVPEERILQWVADKLEYSKLPAEQKAILDARKQAESRALQAEQQVGHYQQQHEQILTQQVQMALDSTLARAEVDAVAKAYDARMGKPGAFKAEVNRRGDYIWRTENKVAPPEQLVQELMSILGPVAPPAAVSPQAPVAPAAPAVPAAKTPVIPNISGRSTSALPTSVKSIADLRAKHKELQARRS